jgi:plasmid stabilization system protein ParE
MNYELRLPPDTRNEIRDYLNDRFGNDTQRLAALAAITQELEKLAVNPALGSSHPGGPFESRRIYRFSIAIGGVTRYVQVAYAVRSEARVIVVSGFAPIQL